MKKLMLTLFAAIIAAATVSAQDLNTLTDTYNNGATALSMGDKASAISYFQQAIELAKALPDNPQAKEIAEKCNEHIPIVQFSIAKDFVNAADYDNAVAELKKTIETAEAFKEQARAQAAMEMYKDLYKQQITDQMALNDATAKLNELKG